MPFPFLAAATAAAPVLGAALQSIFNRRNSDRANTYNHPVNQMKRLKQAGLNPNLMYQLGNVGSFTPVQTTNWQDAVGNAPARYAQSELTQTQTDVGQQRIAESQTKQDLMEAQEDLIRANPNLNPQLMAAMVKNAEALAGMADNKYKWESTMDTYQTGPNEVTMMPRGLHKFLAEINTIDQKFQLGEKDLALKAEVFKSMEFKNYMNDIIKKYIDEGSVNGDSVRFFISVLFNKFM